MERTDSTARVTMYGRQRVSGDGTGHTTFVYLDEVVEVGAIGRTPFTIRVVRDETGATIELDIRQLAFNPRTPTDGVIES